MKLIKLDHVGIAVKSLDSARSMYSDLLNTEPFKEEFVEREEVLTVFYQVGETKIELLIPTADSSPVAKFISKRGEGMHHLAYQVEDVMETIKELKSKGVEVLYDPPRAGANNTLVTFVHPKFANGVLTEYCQYN